MVTNYLSKAVQAYRNWKYKGMMQGIFSDSRPVFTSFGKDIYASDVVNNCIDRIATEISKMNVMSVVETESGIRIQNDDITKLFRFRPNPLQSTPDFLASCVWLQRKMMHCFIFPQWEEITDKYGNTFRRYTAFYPLNPVSVEMGLDRDDGRTWLIRFFWKDGGQDTLPYSDIIHLKWRRGTNLIVGGGNDQGGPDTQDILKACTNLHETMEGLPLSIAASLKLNGLFITKTLVDKDKLKAARDDFEKHIMKSKMGIAAIDLAGEFVPITSRQAVIPKTAMDFFKSIIRQRFGVSEEILDGSFNGDQHAAFYQACIEDFIEEFQKAASGVLFTPREQDIGHRIRCYYNKVEYYSTADKIQLATIAHNTGIMTLNQINEMFGIEPFEGGNRRLQSLNYVNVELVDKYQLGAKGVKTNAKPDAQESDE
ncbi:MAG: phage portal protein [Lachnospiraceae bacterium]|nr:phage portal protein [Lachnospiraceae bacterium]